MTQGIVPTFDPDTGAPGGPAAGGGVSLASLPWRTVDLTDGSWTLTDPDSLVKSNTYSGGFNNVVMNVLAAGNTDYAWGSAADNDQRAPRWTAPLTATDASGNEVRIKSGDTFVLQIRMTKGTTTAEWSTEVVAASTVDGTALTSFDNDAQGGMLEYIAGGNTGYGAFTFSSKTVTTGANNDKGVMTALHAGARGQGVVYITLDNTDSALNGGSRNAAMAYANGTTDMNLMVGVGTRGSSTITDGDDTDFKVEYRAVAFQA